MSMILDFEKYQEKVIGIKFIKDEYTETNSYESINIITNSKTFILNAIADCCSVSYIKQFKKFKFDNIIGKTIISIKEIDSDDYSSVEESSDDDDCYVSNHIYEIKFKDDDESFKFLLKNLSNGYYSGWVEFNVVNNILCET
jgi:hypothetical protein